MLPNVHWKTAKKKPYTVEDLKSEMKIFLAMFSTFREKSDCKSNFFAFWNEYIIIMGNDTSAVYKSEKGR